jgi:glycosyltransferase involved in cell wall biosynthesis
MSGIKKIVIDIRMLHNSGITTYIVNIIFQIVNELKKQCNFCFLINESDNDLIDELIPKGENIKFIKIKSKIYSINEQIEIPLKLPRNIDLYWSPHYIFPLLYTGSLMVTVHDLCHVAMPRIFKKRFMQAYANFMFGAVRQKATNILCVSEFTRGQLELFFPKKRGNQVVSTIYNGIKKPESKKINSKNLKLKESKFNTPFILSVGNVKPHKNLKCLLEAFKQVSDDIPHCLVIVGERERFMTNENFSDYDTLELSNQIYFTGYIEEDELWEHYNNADIFVFPSLYEGFGLPPLEAMSAGCPVIASNASSMPEVCGDAAIYFDPFNHKELAEKILMVLYNPTLREELTKRGFERSKFFSWDKTAEKITVIIRKILKIN